MTNPLISIIIPTYNRAHLISETLDSIITQTYANWECIVVDDGSKDNTNQVLHKYCNKDQRIKYYQRPKNLLSGGNAARNYGFQKSQGEYINWFDDDDLMHKRFLETKISQLSVNDSFVLTLGSLKYQDDLFNEIEVEDYQVKNLFKEYLLCKFQMFTPNIIFQRRFLKTNKLFSESIVRGQETELLSRIFFKAVLSDFKVIKAPLFFYRQHEETKSHQSKNYDSNIKQSQVSIYIVNLKRSIELKDAELIRYCLNLVVDVFFSAVKNKDSQLSKGILKELYLISVKVNRWKALLVYILGGGIINSRSIRFRVKKIFKNSLKFIYS